jgi:hypothetical protein
MSARTESSLQQLAAKFPPGHHERMLTTMEEIERALGDQR